MKQTAYHPFRGFVLLFFLFLSLISYSQVTVVSYASSWKYLDSNTRPAGWETSGYNDAAWVSGNGQLGYGDGDEATVVSYGPDANNKYITTYFRKTINIPDPSVYTSFTLNVRRDDGVVVYINGTERFRNNMPGGAVAHGTLASAAAADDGNTAQTTALLTSYFLSGTNVIAVEIHQNAANSSDLTFDLELLGIPVPLIAYGSSWKYLDNNTRPAGWETSGYNDAAWVNGNAELGYGDGGEATIVSYGPDANNKYTATYFRKTINITGVNNYTSFDFSVVRDDGYVVYVNGVEVSRDNMPAGAIAHGTLASTAISGAGETTPVSFSVSLCSGYFVEGSNTIAVEMHQNAGNSSDLSFDLQLIGNTSGGGSPTLTRGPYLQMGGQTSVSLRWRTSTACIGRVEIGSSAGTYSLGTFDESCSATEHEINVTGLTADTKYFYRVSTTSGTIFQGAADNFFTTLPLANTTRVIRIAAFGDCGRNDNSFQTQTLAQYQSYLTANSIDAPDALILLGDNAYTNGTDAEYTTNFFGAYGNNILKNHKTYPTPGNHDYYGTSQTSRSGAYYLNFTMPSAGEIGGVASGTEAFYSFDIGDIHFLSLDSYGQEAPGNTRLYDTLGTQVTWIKNDLAATTKKWKIAYWHHPPYTMGSHNSDSEAELINIRFNFIRILERLGVDMIICGHSHDYERSYLLDGHYGNEASFNVGTHALSNSSGNYNGTANSCPYVYQSDASNHGTVYVVAGSSGADGGVQAGYPHNAFPFSQDDGGMLYFEIDNNRLDAKFIRRDGVIADRFTIMKDVNQTTNYNIANSASQQLTASWPGNYSWSTTATTRSITVSPPDNATTNYTVTDNFGCITDQFSVTTSGTLPVLLTDYKVLLDKDKVVVRWSTVSESNSHYFTVERSSDGRSFAAIGRVNSYGNSNQVRQYEWLDISPLTGVSYYRLSQTDLDGTKKYYDIKRINRDPAQSFYADAYSSGTGQVTINVYNDKSEQVALRILDVSGRVIKKEKWDIPEGSDAKIFALQKGIIIIEIRKNNGEVFRRKISVQ